MKIKQFKMNWKYICSYINHNLYRELSTSLESTINKKNIKENDFEIKTINEILNYLTTKRNLDIEIKQYTQKLIKQSIQYNHYNNSRMFDNFI